MPINKDFKRLVRGRMRKTGEAYTTARAQLLRKQRQDPAPSAPDYARLAGMSDSAVKARTGCTWERWVYALDRARAHTWNHREIAEHVHQKYKVSGWWAQTVTVGYERIKGLREIGQRRDGGFEASRSRTVAVPVAELFRAFADTRRARKWLPGITFTVRKATPHRSVRITWPDGTSVETWFTPKGSAKAQVQVQHRRLPSREAATAMREYWGERLDALVTHLSTPPRSK